MKLGGSVITFKERALAPNLESLDGLSQAMAEARRPLVVIHGGGSFGHHYAGLFGLDRHSRRASPEAVAKTRAAMLELNGHVVESLERHGLHAYTVPPCDFMAGRRFIASRGKLFTSLIESGLVPVTFGDVLPDGGSFYILSGDEIARLLAERLRPARVMFTVDVDGILRSRDDASSLIREMSPQEAGRLRFAANAQDVTGGMDLKLKEAVAIASLGIDVMFVNGFRPREAFKALIGAEFRGTLVRGVKRGSGRRGAGSPRGDR